MNQLGLHRGAVVCGLLLGILLLAGCGSQSNQSANALDRLSAAPVSTSTASFGVTFEQTDVQVARRAGFTVKQPGRKSMVQPEANAPMRITFVRGDEAHSQAQTQMAAHHQCMD